MRARSGSPVVQFPLQYVVGSKLELKKLQSPDADELEEMPQQIAKEQRVSAVGGEGMGAQDG